MKLDGLTHPKTKELALRLGIPLPYAVGLLDFLWAFVAQQTPQGNIGKWSNGVIAQESQWSGDADEFVLALVEIGFLDEHEQHRLLVHDWSDHAPNWVHAKLKKKGLHILSGDLRADLRSDLPPIPEATTSLAKPSQDKKEEPMSGKPDLPTEVFTHWQQAMNHPRAKLDDKRRKKIAARLKDGYTVDDLKAAVDGCKKSPHHMGQNDTGTVYDDIELICRDASHVDKFVALAGGRNLRLVEPTPPSRRLI